MVPEEDVAGLNFDTWGRFESCRLGSIDILFLLSASALSPSARRFFACFGAFTAMFPLGLAPWKVVVAAVAVARGTWCVIRDEISESGVGWKGPLQCSPRSWTSVSDITAYSVTGAP